ncbi:MAG: cation-translocating P-type ATPase [Wenzhouxiangella sp.]
MPESNKPWHALRAEELLETLQTGRQGLSPATAAERLERFGPNRLPDPPKKPAWARLLVQFHNLLIYVLMAAGMAALLLDHLIDAIVILAVVVINALIGFVQEGKAEQAMAAIGRMLALKATVRRGGCWAEITADTLVPGDIVRVKSGDRVPADIRLLEAHGLRIDQAALTGESVPVSKTPDPVPADTDLADRRCMIYSGSMTTSGQAIGVVAVTGARTELGRISDLLQQVEKLTTPLLGKINHFARLLTVIILTLTGTVIALGMLLHGMALGDGLLAGIALAVAAIPEGLPAIITITLAIGVQQMAQRQAIIRQLPAVETLGSVSIICSDKTGTLTANELKARAVALVEGLYPLDEQQLESQAGRDLLRAGVLCNDFEPGSTSGDPLERALVGLAESHEMDVAGLRQRYPRIGLIPFSSDHKFMASLAEGLVTLKGAPEAILSRCEFQHDGHEARPLDHDLWNERLNEMTHAGLRVLAVAEKPIDPSIEALDPDRPPEGLTMLGLIGFADPPRPQVPGAIRSCQNAGIRVKMITGDHVATARAIAVELGLMRSDGQALSGHEIDQLSAEELHRRVMDVDVFARTTPEHKLRLVEALQDNHQVVAMTGDGANDAPALKRADIGVAMGIKGTEASRQAAEMVLADDNFATIVSGVEEGRGVYDNIRKAILFVLPTNAAQALVIILAVLAGLVLPITPVQILWVNMVISITLALSLAFEPLENNVMHRPPRPMDQELLTSFVVVRIIWVGLLLTAGTFVLFNHVLAASGDEALARTMAVNVLVAGQITYLFNCRRWQSSTLTIEALLCNRWAWISVALLVGLQVMFTYLPAAQAVFGTAALPIGYYWLVFAFGLLVFFLVEAEKALTRQLGLGWAAPDGQRTSQPPYS